MPLLLNGEGCLTEDLFILMGISFRKSYARNKGEGGSRKRDFFSLGTLLVKSPTDTNVG